MKDKLLEIINHYGVIPQLKYFQSEIFELNQSIIEYEDYRNENYDYGIGAYDWGVKRNHIAEEIADVLVMLKQFQLYYGIESNQVKTIMEQKVDRQLERIKEEK